MQSQNFELSPSVGYRPTKKMSPLVPLLITDHILRRKLNGAKFLNMKQRLSGLYPRIIAHASHFLPKIVPFDTALLHPPGVDYFTFP